MSNKLTQADAENAVRTLINWIGDDPEREGVIDTPRRVIESFKELFGGYGVNPKDILQRTFEEVGNYDEMVVLNNIHFESHCEHHMLPIIGKVHIGYLPDKSVVGISKLSRVVDAYAKRLQIQERMTAQVAKAIQDVLNPKGVGVVVEATHHCMSTRGVHKRGMIMKTSYMTGLFRSDARTRKEFLTLIGNISGNDNSLVI